jgi:hypothetical protein
MKKILVLFMVFVFMAISMVQGQITASITLKDASNHVIDNTTINIGSTITIHCTYNSNGAGNALGKLAVMINNSSYIILVQNQSMTNGQVFTYQYKPTTIGDYNFRWTCKLDNGDECAETTQVRTRITLAIPEPATIMGIISAIGALVLYAKRKHGKNE